jgi:hypothetical protein
MPPTNNPFFHDLPQPKKVVTPKGEVLIRKTCKFGSEFMGRAHQPRCEKCAAKKVERK